MFLCLSGCSYLSVQSLASSAAAVLNAVSCNSVSFTGAGSDSCTITLSAAAPAGGVVVRLASNDTAVKVPASLTVPAGATSATFTATVNAAWIVQTATLTATSGSTSKTFALTLNIAPYLVMFSTSSIAFGDVTLNTPATQSLILTSMGTSAIAVSSASVTGAGFSVAGPSFPLTLQPHQSATLDLEFDPKVAGAVVGILKIVSNSSTSTLHEVALTGTGASTAYQVNVSWTAPASPPVEISGYRIFRATGTSTTYQLLNASIVDATSFVDTTVAEGVSYDYYVESVDTAGVASAPSTVFSVSIP